MLVGLWGKWKEKYLEVVFCQIVVEVVDADFGATGA